MRDAAFISLIVLVASVLIAPVAAVLLPADTLVRDERPSPASAGRYAVFVLRNLAGLLLILIGIALLVLPGQGLLTILAGVVLSDVPGKRLLLRRFLGRPSVLGPLNRLRARFGRAPLSPPPPKAAAPRWRRGLAASPSPGRTSSRSR